MESKEERLTKIVQRLDAKLQGILRENKELKQRLELAQLDQQLAEEQAQQSTADLEESRKRLVELEELREVNSELEESLNFEKDQLESQVAELREQLQNVNSHTQSYESLKLELKKSERQAKTAQTELEIIKHGVFVALSPIIPKETAPWLPLIDLLERASVSPSIREYTEGKISVPKLVEKLNAELNERIDSPLVFDNLNVETLSTEIQKLDPSNELDRVKVKLDLAIEKQEKTKEIKEDGENPQSVTTDHSVLKRELEETHLRNTILEAKLKQAQIISEELNNLKIWQSEAKNRETELTLQITTLKEQLSKRESELTFQRRKNLPIRLIEQTHLNQVQQLEKTIAYLSSQEEPLELTPLKLRRIGKISTLIGNPRLKKLRQVAQSLKVGETPKECRKIALEREIDLMLV